MNRYPELKEVLGLLAGKITTEEMISMNNRVDQQHQNPEEVARSFLKEQGIEIREVNDENPDLWIGGKNFTEHFILGHMLALLIESKTGLSVGTQLGLAGTKIVFDALHNGEIDLYPEYTGTGLHVLLETDREEIRGLDNDSRNVYEYVNKETQRRFDLTWLEPFGFENTYALMMRQKQAERLNIDTITDLAEYLESESK